MMEEKDALKGQEAVESTPEKDNVVPEQEESMENLPSMADLLDAEEYKVDLPQRGEIRTGVIASVAPSQILVSIGAKSEGVIAGRALDDISPETIASFEPGNKRTYRS